MCKTGVACGPCEARRALHESRLVAIEHAEDDAKERLVDVWGPASAEVESKDGKIIAVEALEQALPQLLRRGGVDLFHRSAFTVGKVVPELRPDAKRIRNARVRAMVEEQEGVLRSGAVLVTQTIVDVFPKLRPLKGSRQFFLASRIYGDNDTSRTAQERALRGELDSYSIAGIGTEVEAAEVCTSGNECRVIERVVKFDAGAVTICGTQPRPEVGVPQAKNPLAGFVIVQMAMDRALFTEKSSMKPSTSPALPVEHADDNQNGGDTGGDPLAQLQKAAVDQGRRIEQLEQRLAEVAGSPRNTPDEKVEEEADGEEKPDGEADDKEKDTMKPGQKPDEKKPDEKPVEQAQPAADAAPPAWFTGFVTTQLPKIVEQAVKAHVPAAPAAVEHAQTSTTGAPPAAPGLPSIAATPKPAAPATGQPAGGEKTITARLIEAAESGDPAAFQNAWREGYPTLRQELRGSPKVN